MSSCSSSSHDDYTNYTLNLLDQVDDSSDDGVNSRRYVRRDHYDAHNRLMDDYFNEGCKYTEDQFKRRFRMRRRVFLRVMNDILSYDVNPLPSHFIWFHRRQDSRGMWSIIPHLKITAALRQLAYGYTPDALDEYLQMSERVGRESLLNFTMCIIDLYNSDYLREPSSHDIQRLYEAHERIHGLPGMLGSIDCMHWAWAKCSVAWRGQYMRGDHSHPTIMLEAVASYDNWIWHAYFGVAGSNNDLNVLNTSDLFNSMLNEDMPDVPFIANGVEYKRGYYLADEIYPTWASFVKGFSSAVDEKRTYFSRQQAAARKDVERTFGILQGRWHILQQPARAYARNQMRRLMYTCIIQHNIIIEDNDYNLAENDWVYEPPQHIQRTWIERCDARAR
ncbi:protein ALP1-like [Rutidosis leptorrhynchoides]|uniref:protein ALP1-like n=1 Tax=Rutidosis leptorrhynchoides TaxID=125765 RepID=UPI003A98FB0D